jgi:type VI secretion system protein VasD
MVRPQNAKGMVLRRFGILPVCAIVLSTACAHHAKATRQKAGASCPVPNDVQLEIEASDRVNPDEDGRSLPTRLRLYQLTDLARLQRASFDDIWSRAKETLAETALSSEELVIYPGQVTVHRFKRNPKADFMVGVAIFREPEGEAWRTAQEWPLTGDPCEASGKQPAQKLDKLRLRMFLEGNRLESVNNYTELPTRTCRGGGADCAPAATATDATELRRNKRLRTFEEDPREPEITPAAPVE